jgi:Domain of unknown function (DUF4920)
MRTLLLLAVAALTIHASELKIGQPLKARRTVTLTELAANPDAYVGKTFRVKGTITEVCQAMGCWVVLTDSTGAKMRIQMQEGKVAFPKDASGRSAVAEGKLARYELSREDAMASAKHEAEDAGRPFDPEKVKASVVYQIEGTGAVLID